LSARDRAIRIPAPISMNFVAYARTGKINAAGLNTKRIMPEATAIFPKIVVWGISFFLNRRRISIPRE